MKTKKHISQEELKEKLMRALTISFIIYLFFSCTYQKANDSIKKKSIIAQPDTIQERNESFEYFIIAKIIDKTRNIAQVGEFLINIGGGIPNDLENGEFVEFRVRRIDIY